jgi:hypothetical protein
LRDIQNQYSPSRKASRGQDNTTALFAKAWYYCTAGADEDRGAVVPVPVLKKKVVQVVPVLVLRMVEVQAMPFCWC